MATETPERVDYLAATAKARKASALSYARRRHAKWATEMLAYGHAVTLVPLEEMTPPEDATPQKGA